MKRKIPYIILGIILAAGILVLLSYYVAQNMPAWQNDSIQEKEKRNTVLPEEYSESNISSIKGGFYPTDLKANTTMIYLVDSNIKYGVYDKDFTDLPYNISACKGDPSIIINGTIRNDYDRDYYICPTAEVYDQNGSSVGRVITDENTPWFPYIRNFYLKSKSMRSFEIYIKYDKKDIEDYSVYIAIGPREEPLP